MSLFDFFRNKQAEVEQSKKEELEEEIDDDYYSDDDEELEESEGDLSITIKFGTESVEVPLNQVQGQRLIDVVRQYEVDLGIDSDRVTSFRSNGTTVSSNSVVREAGEYSATINAMEKAHS